MLGRKLKNSGMTLVEVLVSMLVLSIAAVTVISAFSMAAQVNTKAKKQQGTAALMENMLEYAEAGGEDFQTWFGVSAADYSEPAPGVTPGPNEKVEELRNVQSGLLKYTVRVTTDTAPSEYEAGDLLHKTQEVIQFGGSGSNAILIDATGTSNDAMVRDLFHSMHVSAVTVHNAEEDIKEAECLENGVPYVDDRWTEKSATEVNSLIDREIWIYSEPVSGDTYRVVGYITYTVSDSLELGDGTVNRVYKVPLCTSEEFDKESGGSGTKFLKQIYVMYSTPLEADSGGNLRRLGNDIRIWDSAGMMDVNLYLVKQTDSLKDIGEASEEHLDDWFTPGDKVLISCKNESNVQTLPIALNIYSSVSVETEATIPTGDGQPVQVYSESLLEKAEEVKVAKITIQIFDSDTGNELAVEEVVRLQ